MIRKKIITVGAAVFFVFVILAAMTIWTHREVSFSLRVRDNVNAELAGVREFVKWKNALIRSISDIMASGHVPPLTVDQFRNPPGSQMKEQSTLVKSGQRLVGLIAEKEQARAEIDRAYSDIRTQINTLYYKLDDKIATVLAIAQMDKVLGVDAAEHLALAPYVLKSLNQLTLVSMNGLISRSVSEEDKGVVTKNRRFVSSQLQLIDPDGGIADLFADLFAQIESLETLIVESEKTLSLFETRIQRSKADFDLAVKKTEIDSTVRDVQSDLDHADERLERASRRSLTMVVIFLFVVPLLVVILGFFGLNKTILGPITHLMDAMKHVEEGRFDVTAPISARDEIGKLAHAFNVMTAEINTKVSEMSRLNRVLRESEAKYRTLVDNLPQRVFFKNKHSVYVSCNRSFVDNMNIHEDEIAGKTDFDLFPRELAEKYRKDDARILAGGRPEEIEETIFVNGQNFVVNTIKTPVRNDNGAVTGVLGIAWDITRRKEMEDALRLTQFIFDNAPIGIWRMGPEGEILDVNEQGSQSLGYSREELRRMMVFDFTPGFDPVHWAEGRAILNEVGTKISDVFHRHRNGNVIPIQVIEKLVRYEGLELHVAFVQDISERKQMEQVLRESEERLKDLVSNVPGVVYQFTLEPNAVTSVIKEKSIALLGLDSEPEDFFDDFVACLPEEDRPRFVASVKDAVERVKPWYYEGRFIKVSGEEIWIECSSVPRKVDGSVVFYGVTMDITWRREMESSLRLTQFIFDKASVGIYRVDEKGRLLDVNEQVCRNLGYTREELCHMTVFDIDPDYTPGRYADLMVKLRHIRAQTIETRHLRKNGEIFPVQLQLNVSQYENQEFMVVFEEDISQRKQAERALKESEQRLDLALEGANEGIWDWDMIEDILYLDDRYYTMAGYSPNEFPGRSEEIEKRIHPDDTGRTASVTDQYLAGNLETFEVEFRFLHKDGSYLWVRDKGKIVSRDADGNPTRFIGTHADITDRKLAEKALRENEQLLGNILESMSEGIFVLNSHFEHTIINSALEIIGEMSKKEVLGKIPWEVFPRLKDTPVKENIKRTMIGESTGISEFRLPLPSGRMKWLRIGFSPLRDENGSVVGIVGVVTDISQRKQDEEELRRLQHYLSNIIDSMPSILIAVDRDGNITQWNNRTEQTTGLRFEEARSQPLVRVFPRLSGEMARIKTAIRERRVIGSSKVSHKVAQETRFENITIFPLVANGVEGAVIRVDDVTEQVRLEEMMIQGEKMLSVGGLAAGMAHEINNPLAGMMQTAEVMVNRLVNNLHIPANQKAAEAAGTTLAAIERFMAVRGIPRMLSTINESGQRVAAIVENMLSFARKSESMVSSNDLGILLDKTLELAATDYNLKKQYDFRRIAVVKAYADPPVLAPCERAKIQQVLLNILRNGAQAMQEAQTESPRFMLRTSVAADSDMAVIEIEDNGPGMDEATRKRIFEPFFTTKPIGVGTGLGLSVSYFIITENHRGEMSVESSPGAGTKFIIRLPLEGKAVEKTR